MPRVMDCSFRFVVAMANGNILMSGLEPGIDSDNIYESGEYLYEWNSATNTCSQIEPTAGTVGFEVDSLARSALTGYYALRGNCYTPTPGAYACASGGVRRMAPECGSGELGGAGCGHRPKCLVVWIS
jgi:hypothetical protein